MVDAPRLAVCVDDQVLRAVHETERRGIEQAGLGREVTFPRGPSATVTMTGEAYLTRFAIPNCYFHATTAYDILRQNGFQIGKQDFLKGVFDA